ncbi:hypothetical protein FSARC_3993 [Fusarium sarcochroum]|uniref:ATPase synthesis protein 25 n=1 Tax=Fusarium sarcochroum TaxID=1208366 RepID=A0A8H4U2T9_9HYPO|nr:hypothetical protein FSARC_3993 [Fusarium sarcochroum]
MLTRPVAAALTCRQCQSAIIRAVVSRPATSSFRTLPRTTSRQLPALATRFFSDVKTNDPIIEKEDATANIASDAPETTPSGDVPWFLEVEPPRHAESQHAVQLPKIPEGAPEVLEPMVKYIFEDMGLDDISLLDMRDLDPPAALGPNLIMLFATTRSERHLHISSGRFIRWLRKKYNISARADGLIGPGELRTKLRRLRKKAKLMGTNTAIIPGGDNGISTGWVCVNFSSNSDNIDEAAKVDDTGRFSGFGAPQTGTTVVVQCMTESRRAELDLETLWQGILKKSLRENKQARGEKINSPEELDQLLASKVQLPSSGSASQWQALKKASQQQRNYTTSARRLSPPLTKTSYSQYNEPLPANETRAPAEEDIEEPIPDLAQVCKQFEDIQLVGTHLTQDQLYQFLRYAMTAPSVEPAAGSRLSFIDQILLTAEERGMEVWNDEMFVTLIEAGLASPSYEQPELKQAQENLETLMTQKRCQPNNYQIARLMVAYAERKDWPRFWDTFRLPARFKMGKDARLYDLTYRIMAATESQKMCIEALRWVYPEMMNEEDPVLLLGPVYHSLKACIRVADPQAPWLIHQGAEYEQSLKFFSQRRFVNREFVKLLKEVEKIHAEIFSQEAKYLISENMSGMQQ